MTPENQRLAAEAAGRLGDIDVYGTQISAICSMLRALYAAHPEPVQVRGHFDRFLAHLLDSPYIKDDPDRMLVLQDTAAALLHSPSASGMEERGRR